MRGDVKLESSDAKERATRSCNSPRILKYNGLHPVSKANGKAMKETKMVCKC